MTKGEIKFYGWFFAFLRGGSSLVQVWVVFTWACDRTFGNALLFVIATLIERGIEKLFKVFDSFYNNGNGQV